MCNAYDRSQMNDEPWTIGRLLQWTTDFLREKGADNPRLDAEVLLAHACDCPRIQLYTTFDDEPSEQTRTSYRELVKRRAAGTPVAYLVGHREFFSLTFEVTPDVLIPRPETEQLVVRAIDLAKEARVASIADVGTGSGILAVCCAKHLPLASVTAIDISATALAVATRNAERHSVAERITFVESNLFENLPNQQQFDLILSNPPYVSTEEMAELDPEVRDFEPHLALDGGVQGMEIVERLLKQSVDRLRPDGWLLIEVSPMNAKRVEQLVDEMTGLNRQATLNDLAGHARVIQVTRASS